MKHYLTKIFKSDTSSDYIKEKLDNWLDLFEKFHKKYIIMPSDSLDYFFPEDSRYITVISQPGFINRENEKIFYFNATIQLLYCNVIFRQFILNIDFYTMILSLDKSNQTFVRYYQKILIVKELQKILVICL